MAMRRVCVCLLAIFAATVAFTFSLIAFADVGVPDALRFFGAVGTPVAAILAFVLGVRLARNEE